VDGGGRRVGEAAGECGDFLVGREYRPLGGGVNRLGCRVQQPPEDVDFLTLLLGGPGEQTANERGSLTGGVVVKRHDAV
jgi:hypothetical protein